MEARKRVPAIEVRCPACGTRTIWHHLPKAGDECRWCGHEFGDFEWHRPEGARHGKRSE